MASSRHPLRPAVWFAVGAAGGLLGLAPWLLTGARLPLQNLGRAADMPIALLPFNQYYLTAIVALVVVGSAAAGIAGRARGVRDAPSGTAALLGGTLAVQLVAAVQSTVVTAALLESSSRAALYLGLVLAVIVISLLVGALVLLLITRTGIPGATIAFSLAALVTPSWIRTAFGDFFTYGPYELTTIVYAVLRWLPAVLVGAAIAWCGFRTARRVAAALTSLAALWIGPAFFTGVANAAGMRVLASNPAEMIEYGIQVFFAALTTPELAAPPLIVAAVIGLAGSGLLGAVRRRRGARMPDPH